MTASRKRRLPSHIDRLSRYDLVLAVIPIGFLLVALASVTLSVPLRTLLPAWSLVGVLVLADGLYFNPPGTGPET
jgi:hypothetical protein